MGKDNNDGVGAFIASAIVLGYGIYKILKSADKEEAQIETNKSNSATPQNPTIDPLYESKIKLANAKYELDLINKKNKEETYFADRRSGKKVNVCSYSGCYETDDLIKCTRCKEKYSCKEHSWGDWCWDCGYDANNESD